MLLQAFQNLEIAFGVKNIAHFSSERSDRRDEIARRCLKPDSNARQGHESGGPGLIYYILFSLPAILRHCSLLSSFRLFISCLRCNSLSFFFLVSKIWKRKNHFSQETFWLPRDCNFLTHVESTWGEWDAKGKHHQKETSLNDVFNTWWHDFFLRFSFHTLLAPSHRKLMYQKEIPFSCIMRAWTLCNQWTFIIGCTRNAGTDSLFCALAPSLSFHLQSEIRSTGSIVCNWYP